MRRSASESNCWVDPPWGTQVPPPHSWLKLATGMVVGPVNVELAGFAKSACSLNNCKEAPLPPMATKKFGSPEGGGFVPSRSEGSSVLAAVVASKQTICKGCPFSMAVRLNAQARGVPLPKIFAVK